jgi:hypothetical protein
VLNADCHATFRHLVFSSGSFYYNFFKIKKKIKKKGDNLVTFTTTK